MKTPAIRLLAAAALMVAIHVPARGQISMQPTPPPTATAENEPWYLSGEPVSFNGNLYYASGPITHFLRNEMVRTGIYGNTPIYIRTTQEPGSIIYVPLPGGLVRPYERRRSGDLAGTVGSTVPSFRVVLPAEEAGETVIAGIQAPAPPTGVPVGTMGAVPASTPYGPTMAAAPQPASPMSVGTAGTVELPPFPARTSVETVRRPVGLNTVFVDYENTRWFAAGPAIEFSAQRFVRVGDLGGSAVYQESGRSDVIYLSTVPGTSALVTPYKKRS